MRRRTNPKFGRFTQEQEAALTQTELMMARCRIIERGVAAILNTGEYASASEIEEAAKALTESVAIRIQCETERAAIRRAEAESHPIRKNRVTAVHLKKRRK